MLEKFSSPEHFSQADKLTKNDSLEMLKRDLPLESNSDWEVKPLPKVQELPPLLAVEGKCLPTSGEWIGEKGNSIWKPESTVKPDPENGKGGNPDKLTWQEIQEKHKIDGVEFKDGYPDFSSISAGEVKVEPFTENRNLNFAQADEKLAEKWNDEKKDGKEWTARDIKEFRQSERYTWHECEDCQTMQLVPKEIHNNTPHSGGISEIKKQQVGA